MDIIKQAYRKKQPKIKKVWVCTKCGSSNVQYRSWINANTGMCADELIFDDSADDYWCDDCKSHIELKQIELKSDAHVIGFQVIGFGSCNEGLIHPEMLNADSVYCLSQAKVILNIKTINPNKTGYNKDWRLKAIWKDDIENLTMMYLGSNPRD